MSDNPLIRARDEAQSEAADLQERNRLWWEKLPMTYVDFFERNDRTDGSPPPQQVRRQFLDGNPWLTSEFDFKRFKDRRVLEVGCGSGAAACLLAEGGATVTGVDITHRAIEMTRESAKAFGVVVDARRMDAERMTFADGSFDYVFSWGVLHHSHEPSAAFREVSRVLRPGGEGLIMVYNKNSLRYYVMGLYWLIAKGKLGRGETLDQVQNYFTDGYYHRHYRPWELRADLASQGLAVTRISITHMGHKMIPICPGFADELLKRTLGWLLVVEFVKR